MRGAERCLPAAGCLISAVPRGCSLTKQRRATEGFLFLKGLLLQIMDIEIYFFWLKISLAFLHLAVQLCVKVNCKFSKQFSTTPSIYSIHRH